MWLMYRNYNFNYHYIWAFLFEKSFMEYHINKICKKCYNIIEDYEQHSIYHQFQLLYVEYDVRFDIYYQEN
jgi:hypothetical protein